MRSVHSLVVGVVIVVLAGCSDVADSSSDTQSAGSAAVAETDEAGQSAQATETQEPTDTTEPTSSEVVIDAQTYSSLAILGDESALPAGGDDVSLVALGPPDSTVIPFLLHNGTGGAISRVEVSGRATTGDGETIGTGSSQSVEPNVVPPGGYAFGSVSIDSEDLELPSDAVIEDPAIDFTEWLREFENIIAADVENVERVGDAYTGDVTNPHDELLSGPISVGVACLTSDGGIATASTFTDRDELEAGESSTFTIDLFDFPGDDECVVTLLGASGFEGF